MRLATTITFTCAAVLLAGCGLSIGPQPGQTALAYNVQSGTLPTMKTLKTPSRYSLYGSDPSEPIFTTHLWPDDQIGFARDADGKLVGVIVDEDGQRTIQLTGPPATTYVWKYE